MNRHIRLAIIPLALMLLLPACNRSKTGLAPDFTHTAPGSSALPAPFRDESQFIVWSVLSDLTEMAYYARNHRLPEPRSWSGSIQEMPGASAKGLVYRVEIAWEIGQKPLSLKVSVGGPIWLPEVYAPAADSIREAIGLSTNGSAGQQDGGSMPELIDGLATTLERENQRVSQALEKDFSNPVLHEQAAMLLGAFALREHSHYFFDTRAPLNRMTAHLAMAHLLAPDRSPGTSGRLAEIMLLTLMNNQADAVARLSEIAGDTRFPAAWIKILKARNTLDFHPLKSMKQASLSEEIAYFLAFSETGNASVAWNQIPDKKKKMIADFCRIAGDIGFSVETGNELLQLSLPTELAEVSSIYQLVFGRKLNPRDLVPALNSLPERCFSMDPDNRVRVKVIGWGQWASFFQRHLCFDLVRSHDFMKYRLAVPEDAEAYSSKTEKIFGALRLYPLVRRFSTSDDANYQRSQKEGLQLLLSAPQSVPARCWNFLYSAPDFQARPVVLDGEIMERWFHHNPPPGTAYDPAARLHQPTVVGSNWLERVTQLHRLAPYNLDISLFLLDNQYSNAPTETQALDLFGPVIPYYAKGLLVVATTMRNDPDRFERLLLQGVASDPSLYYALGDYFVEHKQDSKAEEYFAKAEALDPDSLGAASYAGWRITYHLNRGEQTVARRIADAAAEVYSQDGLEAKAQFHEAIKDYAQAFEWYAKVFERYDDAGPLVEFCARHKQKTGSDQFAPQLKQIMVGIFPKGLEKVRLNVFTSPPTDGVLVAEENDAVTSAGIKMGDVIVAVYGTRVHSFKQYMYARSFSSNPELDLIVWQGNGYHELKASPPNHRFGVSFTDYKAQ